MDPEPKRTWTIGPYELGVTRREGVATLNRQTADNSLLTTLALAGFADVSRCALDLVFMDEGPADIYDAYGAYSYAPLSDPPDEYVSKFRKVDWGCDSPQQHHYAIILAGWKDANNTNLLKRILKTVNSDYLDAPLFAASAFHEAELLETVCAIALNITENEAFATGAMHGLLHCFRRWISASFTTQTDLARIFPAMQAGRAPRMSWKRLLNYIVCRDWKRLPYPAAPPGELRVSPE
jgi:hypothetical protein